MSKTKRIAGAFVAVAALAASGAAFTASNTVPDTVAGYGSGTITGATMKSVEYTLSATGENITKVDLVILDDHTDATVKVGFGGASLQACTVDGTLNGDGDTTASCNITGTITADASDLHIAVTAPGVTP
jgi:hypothetical protein